MMDAHKVVPTGALRPIEIYTLPQDPNGKSRGNQGPLEWMQYMDPSPGVLRQTPHRTSSGYSTRDQTIG